ncbi:MAG: hypothetical protein ABMA14_09750 [Hyphomonadaceae bacterium]
MKFKWSRTSIAWLCMAGAMYAVAITLTMIITGTQGGLLERGQNDGGDRPVQIASIYEPGATRESADAYYLNYGENASGSEAVLTFVIPPGAKPMLVVSGLLDDNDCTSPRSADSVMESDANGGGVFVTINKLYSHIYDRWLYFVTPTPSDYEETVTCRVHPQGQSETFTSRVLTFLHYAPNHASSFPFPDRLTLTDREDDKAEVANPLQGLYPLPRMRTNFSNIPGSRDIHFLGGFEAADAYAPETKRLLAPGEYIWVFWDDLYSQQMRDIALIVIGTLIGIGVTVMIEGLRPFIESLGKPAPPEKKSDEPPAHSS